MKLWRGETRELGEDLGEQGAKVFGESDGGRR